MPLLREAQEFIKANKKTTVLYGVLFALSYGMFVYQLMPNYQVTALAQAAALASVGVVALGVAEGLAWRMNRKALRSWLVSSGATLLSMTLGLFLLEPSTGSALVAAGLALVYAVVGRRLFRI